AGNSATKDFSVPMSNVPPVVNAGPDTGEAWGIPVAFNGSATDPGSADQSTLGYSWLFGDGTPSASGGPSVMHAYAIPGNYIALLTVCDKNLACATSQRLIFIRRRSVATGFLGDHSGVFDTFSSLNASLVDEFGSAVPGRGVLFTIGAEAA